LLIITFLCAYNSQKGTIYGNLDNMTQVQQISDLPGLLELISKGKDSIPVNQTTAQRHTAVFSCFKALSDDLAGLPVHVYQKKDGKTRKATEHPASDMIKLDPNPEMRVFSWYKARFLHAFATGNSCSLVERSIMNPVKHIWPLDPASVTLERVGATENSRGRLRYCVSDGFGRPKYYDPENILHLKGYTWDGIWGQTAITDFAKSQVGIGLEMDVFQKAFFENGLNPGGIFQHPKSLTEKNKPKFMKALKRKFGGSKKRGLPMVVEDGMEFKAYEIKMADQQFIELLKLNKTDICGILGVPESRISISGSNTNYNNTEAERKRYMESGLLPWAIPDEQEMTFRLLTPADRKAGFYIKYNFAGFLRGSEKERAEIHKIWVNMGVPVNECLALEDRNPVKGGDVGFIQLNQMPIEDGGVIQAPAPVQQKSSGKAPEKRTFETRKLEQIIKARDRIKKRYLPLIEGAIEKIINRENIALSKEITKHLKNRGKSDFSDFIDGFYESFPGFIDKNLRSVLASYAESMQEIVAGEIDLDPDNFGDIGPETKSYLEGYTKQYIDSSRGQIIQQMETDGELEAVQTRVDEWREKRLDKELSEVSVGLGSMVARSVIMGAGFGLVWKTRGKSCPLCNQLNGRKVTKKSQTFTGPGEDFTDEAGKTVTFRQTLYSPLHAGCDCICTAG
jgi:HK97 family phage portal protein